MSQIELSFVLPAFNEEESIVTTLITLEDTVKPRKLPYEIIVVDDGSKDQTISEARKYANRNGHVKVISYDRNRGKGYAIKEGFMQTTGEVVVFADSDMDIDLRTISAYVNALRHGDIAIASKWHPESVVDISILRRIMSHSFNAFVRLLVGIPAKDTQVGLKAVKRRAFEFIFPKLAVKRYAFDVELLAVANLYGLKIVEMPTNLRLQDSFRLIEMLKMFLDLLGIAYRLRLIHSYRRSPCSRNGLQDFVSMVVRER